MRTNQAWALIGMIGIGGLMSCAKLPPTSVYGNMNDTFARIAFEHKMITMVVGQTLQLRLIGHTFAGDSTTDLPDAVYTSSSLQKASVSPTGLVTAREANTPTTLVQIIAAVQRDSVTRYDTTFLYLTNTAPGVPDSLSIIRPDLDTGYLALGNVIYFAPEVYDANGALIPNPPVYYTASRPLTVRLVQSSTSKFATGLAFGETWIYGKTFMYGVALKDSVRVRMTYPTGKYYSYNSNQGRWPDPLFVYLRVGSQVGWNFRVATAPSIVFDKPEAASADPDTPTESGNIPSATGGYKMRIFNTPGTYTWTSGAQTGTIVVMSERYPGE